MAILMAEGIRTDTRIAAVMDIRIRTMTRIPILILILMIQSRAVLIVAAVIKYFRAYSFTY